jgi:hypothetical protein
VIARLSVNAAGKLLALHAEGCQPMTTALGERGGRREKERERERERGRGRRIKSSYIIHPLTI